MTFKKLREEMQKYREELESKLHRKAKLSGMYVVVWGQGGFSLEGWMRASDAELSRSEVLGCGPTIQKLFADARVFSINGSLAKYLKKPKTSPSEGRKRHK